VLEEEFITGYARPRRSSEVIVSASFLSSKRQMMSLCFELRHRRLIQNAVNSLMVLAVLPHRGFGGGIAHRDAGSGGRHWAHLPDVEQIVTI
jgi:hypothetical protein